MESVLVKKGCNQYDHFWQSFQSEFILMTFSVNNEQLILVFFLFTFCLDNLHQVIALCWKMTLAFYI